MSSRIIASSCAGPGVKRRRSVPRGTERLRFTPGPAHDEAMMRELTDALVEIWDRLELQLLKAA